MTGGTRGRCRMRDMHGMSADSVIKVIAFAQVTQDALPTTVMACKRLPIG